jgi:hypothetical protein
MIKQCDGIIAELERACANSKRSVLDALTGCKNLRSIDIPLSDKLIRSQDLHVLASMPFLSSLELCLEEEIIFMDRSVHDYRLDPSQVKSLFSGLFTAVKSLKALKTFVLRDGGCGISGLPRHIRVGFTDYSSFRHPGLMVLESDSLEIVDFSKMEKGFRMESLKCPKLKRLIGAGCYSAFSRKSELPLGRGTVFNPSGVNYQGENHVFGSLWVSRNQGGDNFRFVPIILPQDCEVEER